MILDQIKKILHRIKGFFSDLFVFPPSELSSSKEEEMINMIAKEISKRGMELPASLLGRLLVPTSSIVSEIYIMPLVLYLDLIGLNGFEVAAFFDKKENVKRLVAKIQEMGYINNYA